MSRPCGLKLALGQETTTSSPLMQFQHVEGEDEPMLVLCDTKPSASAGDGLDLGATFEVSASGTLRTQGFVIRQEGIQAAPPARRPSASVGAAGSASGSSASAAAGQPFSPQGFTSPLSPVDGPPAAVALNQADFIELGSVGRGACGVVRRALHVPSLRVVALKEINIYDKDKRHQFVKELTALGSVASPYIVGFAGAYYSEGSITLLLEYANRHSLLEMLRLHGPFGEDMLRRIACHALRGLQLLHQARVIHRDIKPGNILASSRAEFKLTDFGVVTALEGTADFASTFVGTTVYMAPERVAPSEADGGKYSFASDIWSLGITLWNLAVGRLPYETSEKGGGYWGIVKAIRDDAVPPLPEISPASGKLFSAEWRNLLERMLQKDPAKRDSASSLLNHPFLADADAKWDQALQDASARNEPLHPLMQLNASDVADLDAVLNALYKSTYAKKKNGVAAVEYKKSLMDQARLAKLAENLQNPALTLQVVQSRFEKVYEMNRAAGV